MFDFFRRYQPAELVQLYLAHKSQEHHAKTTISTEWYRLKHYVHTPFKDWPKKYHEVSLKRKPITNHKEVKALRVFFNWLMENKFYDENPFLKMTPPPLGERSPKIIFIQDIEKILNAAGGISYKAYAIFYTLLYTGLRKTELTNLQPIHINFPQNQIFVYKGKGNKDRLLPMHPNLRYVLECWNKMRIQEHERFFNLNPKSLERLKKRVQEKAKVHFTIHGFRHSAATYMLECGVPINTVQFILGHSEIQTTMIYNHMRIRYHQEELQKFSHYKIGN